MMSLTIHFGLQLSFVSFPLKNGMAKSSAVSRIDRGVRWDHLCGNFATLNLFISGLGAFTILFRVCEWPPMIT